VGAIDPVNGDAEPIRISDAERDRAIERLNGFFSEGRLSHDEFSARLDEIYAVSTDIELRDVFRQLPRQDPIGEVPAPKPRRRLRTSRIVETATPAAICTAVWAMTGHSYFWPEWVYLGTGIVLLQELRSGGRRNRTRRAPSDRTSSGPPSVSSDKRRVRTVVFIDIVNSTEQLAALGDSQWRSVLGRFKDLADHELGVTGGRMAFTKGDEVVATFHSPTSSLEYACAVRDEIRNQLHLEIRAGIHTGEVQGRPHDLSGIAIHIGQRVSTLASAGQILVSSTVRDLAQGSGFGFADQGEHELRGVPGTWRLFAVNE
jgi:class 3 adenylate cyclase